MKARKYDAVVFDLFGTLVDGPYGQDSSRVAMANVLGVPASDFQKAWGQFRLQRDTGQLATVEKEIKAAMRWLGVEAKPDSIQAAKDIRYRSVRNSLEPRPGAIKLLEELRTSGYALGLISNCSSVVPELWSETPFNTLLDAAIFSASEGLVKPDTEIFSRAAARLGVPPELCVYVGDGESGELDGAAALGMTPWLLLLPHEDPPPVEGHAESVPRWRHRQLQSLGGVLDVLKAGHR